MQRNKMILVSLTAAALFGATNIVLAADDAAQEMQAGNADVQNVHANPANGEKIFKEGKGAVPACMTCHGPEGMGDDNMGTPRLAGQSVVYLIKQLEDFAHGRRKDQTMFVMDTAVAPNLTPEDRVDVAVYVSTKLPILSKELSNVKDLTAAGQKVGLSYLGKEIVLYGLPQKNVPACKSCHQYNGRGQPPIYPQIGQQKYVYLTNQLKHWRDGSRANDPIAQMQHVANKLSDEDIANAAAYLMDAPYSTMGNGFIPEQHIPVAFEPH